MRELFGFPAIQENIDNLVKRLKRAYVAFHSKQYSAFLSVHWRVSKWEDTRIPYLSEPDLPIEELRWGLKRGLWRPPTIVIAPYPNKIVNVGLDECLQLITGEETTHYDNTNAYIGVGDSNTAAAAGQTDLQASTNEHWEGMDASKPTTVASQATEFEATVASGDAQFAWEEQGVASGNDPPSTGVLLGRVVNSFGTKGAASWVATATFSAASSD